MAQTETNSSSGNILRHHWLLASRLGWLALFLAMLATLIAGMPVLYQVASEPEITQNVAQLGLPASIFVIPFMAGNILAGLALAIYALALFLLKSNNRMILLVALMPLALWTALSPGTYYLSLEGAAWNPVIVFLQMVGFSWPVLTCFLFPSGKFTPGWTRNAFILLAVVDALIVILYLFAPSGIPGLYADFGGAFIFIAFFLGLGVLAQIQRYRRMATPLEQQQIKWPLYGLLLLGLVLPVAILIMNADFGAVTLFVALGIMFIVVAMLLFIPATFGIAILRYRLWDIDLIINRSLVYGFLTFSLALIYFAGVAVVQWVFQGVTGLESSTFAAVISTLVIAALFRPLRTRMQDWIDRAFYRQKVDLARNVVEFSREIRTIIDLQQLLNRLVERMGELLHLAYGAIILRSAGNFQLAQAYGQMPESLRTLSLTEHQHAQLRSGAIVSLPEADKFQLLVPLVTPEDRLKKLVGLLALGPRLSGQGYSGDDRSLLMSVTEQVGTAIYVAQLIDEKRRYDDLLNNVIDLAVMLSAEQKFERLLERVLIEAKTISNADAGILYLRTEEEQLALTIVRNDPLDLAIAGNEETDNPPEPLALESEENLTVSQDLACYAARHGETINIDDLSQQSNAVRFHAPRYFSQQGYQAVSALTVPLRDEADQIIGVLQLMNAQDLNTEEIVPFNDGLKRVIESLSALAAIVVASYLREQRLKQEIIQLRIVIDEEKRARDAKAITQASYFAEIKEKALRLRQQLEE